MRREDFESLIDVHGKSLFAFCSKLTGYSDDANDLYQQTFLRSFEMTERIDPDKNPKYRMPTEHEHRAGIGSHHARISQTRIARHYHLEKTSRRMSCLARKVPCCRKPSVT